MKIKSPLLALCALSLFLPACSMNAPTGAVSQSLYGQSRNIAHSNTPYPMASTAPTSAPSSAPVADANQMPQSGNTEDYSRIYENPFLAALKNPLSTFSIDVDTASYSNVRRFLHEGQLPPADAVRIEELINYFRYDYAKPQGDAPFAISTELSDCPWADGHKLLQVGLQAKQLDMSQAPRSNLVFLLDVSGSMGSPDKLPLVKQSLRLLVDQLRENDKISIVVYAGAAGQVLAPTSGEKKETILAALDKLEAGGSTAGGEGIQLAYKIARDNFIPGGNNRVILATDGDFNVGPSSDGELERLIEAKRRDGVYLTVLGYGMGNLKDNKLELLADKGNGNYAYIDTLGEARKVLVQEMGGTLLTVAKDVKLQLEFNPAKVASYRLIGYENRLLAAEDFDNDAKDAGELGAGHTVTALYEIVPAGAGAAQTSELTYSETQLTAAAGSDDLLTLKLRYKQPASETSQLISQAVADHAEPWSEASGNLHFAASVAGFGMLLRDSEYKGKLNFNQVLELGRAGLGPDKEGYRGAYLQLVQQAMQMKR
ncbi:MAG: von Willebrand factor type A domain-containing protein [Candidatus Sericytochromatia bacterium]